MDIIVSSAYLCSMIGRLVTMLTILAIAVVTTISAAHAVRMGDMRVDHAAHQGAMMHASAEVHPSCDGDQHSGSADAAMCEFVCAGLSIYLAMPGVEAGHAFGSADHDFPAEASHVGHAPALNERPPKLRLL
jgi:hypothetical protein